MFCPSCFNCNVVTFPWYFAPRPLTFALDFILCSIFEPYLLIWDDHFFRWPVSLWPFIVWVLLRSLTLTFALYLLTFALCPLPSSMVLISDHTFHCFWARASGILSNTRIQGRHGDFPEAMQRNHKIEVPQPKNLAGRSLAVYKFFSFMGQVNRITKENFVSPILKYLTGIAYHWASIWCTWRSFSGARLHICWRWLIPVNFSFLYRILQGYPVVWFPCHTLWTFCVWCSVWHRKIPPITHSLLV